MYDCIIYILYYISAYIQHNGMSHLKTPATCLYSEPDLSNTRLLRWYLEATCRIPRRKLAGAKSVNKPVPYKDVVDLRRNWRRRQ